MFFFRMAYWVQPQGKLYLPPPKPVGKVFSTDDYVTPTNIYYHGNSDRLLTVGNPYYDVIGTNGKVLVPKVSGNQFRVFRVLLPDPNKFALTDPNVYNPETERLVWKVRGLEIGRGGPLGFGTTGNPLFNRSQDTENPNRFSQNKDPDDRQNVSLDPKQTQLFVIGCEPCLGEHWDIAPRCVDQDPKFTKGDCPPLELISSVIEDGQMCDIGFGAINFDNLQESRAEVPIDISTTTCKWPDFLKMSNDKYGDSCFLFGKREQSYCRHMFVQGGTLGEPIPENMVLKGKAAPRMEVPTDIVYYGTPSGSLVNSDTQLFNRPFWLQRAQGKNNGVCWGNHIFVTVVDNTRNTNFTISQSVNGETIEYTATDFKHYSRHVEEYELSFIFQLCIVKLDPEVLAHINTMNPNILEGWNLGFIPPGPNSIESTYRYLESLATKCPDSVQPKKSEEDPYAKYNFWTVDLREKLSLELDHYSLGRKFMYQAAITRSGSSLRSQKRKLTSTKSVSKKKRKN
ncbi:L1 protein [Mustela putorius papillomavirus 1]|uniref:Major capsid protein L1 n=1 Tax=Mustela putorius papillomavirus 1 TaxID=2259540 RepID=T1YEN9_9PAPI|nr:L1 protein [Mustela putorius papillomavirus 1]AGU62954.1 L1 protein [Mustela putorius papillomavirus 1]